MSTLLHHYSPLGARLRAAERARARRFAAVASETLVCLLIGALVGLALAGCGG